MSGGRQGRRGPRGSRQGPAGTGNREPRSCLRPDRRAGSAPRGGRHSGPKAGMPARLWVPRLGHWRDPPGEQSSAARDEAEHTTAPRVNIRTASGICLIQGRGSKSAPGGHDALCIRLGGFHGEDFNTVLGICCPHRGLSNFLGHLAVFTEEEKKVTNPARLIYDSEKVEGQREHRAWVCTAEPAPGGRTAQGESTSRSLPPCAWPCLWLGGVVV